MKIIKGFQVNLPAHRVLLEFLDGWETQLFEEWWNDSGRENFRNYKSDVKQSVNSLISNERSTNG